jgi:hypothetical protein
LIPAGNNKREAHKLAREERSESEEKRGLEAGKADTTSREGSLGSVSNEPLCVGEGHV